MSTCSTCSNWNPADGGLTGECRHNPPKVFLFPVAVPLQKVVAVPDGSQGGPGLSMIGQTAFPTTPADGWCGAHPERLETMLDAFESS